MIQINEIYFKKQGGPRFIARNIKKTTSKKIIKLSNAETIALQRSRKNSLNFKYLAYLYTFRINFIKSHLPGEFQIFFLAVVVVVVIIVGTRTQSSVKSYRIPNFFFPGAFSVFNILRKLQSVFGFNFQSCRCIFSLRQSAYELSCGLRL